MNSLPFHCGFICARETPRIATSGELIMGVNAVPPIPPSDEMVKHPPCISSRFNLPSRARALISASSRAKVIAPFWSASRRTGTTNPCGVSTATPMLQYFFTIKFSPEGSSEELNSGNSRSAIAAALTRNASGVILNPAFCASSASERRNSSMSVTSASSC